MFTLKRGKVETFSYIVKAANSLSRGDVVAADPAGTVIPATSSTTVENLVGVAANDAAAGEEVLVQVPSERNTTFEADVDGGATVALRYVDLTDEDSIANGAGTVDQFRVMRVLSTTKAEVCFAFATA